MIFRISTNLVLTAALFTLSACAQQSPNQWIPRGYSYQDNTPLSSPAPSSPWLKEAEIQDTEKLAASTAAWQGAIFELVDGIQSALPVDGSPVNVKALPPVTNQDLALDHYVRQALIQKGLTLTTTQGIGLTLTINSQPLTNEAALKQAKTVPNFEYVEDMDVKGFYLLTAKLSDSYGTLLGESKTVGVFPHEKAEYSRIPGLSIAPIAGINNDPTPIYERD
ncbi:MAG: hypothetical protein KDJ26_04175 [Alphaproteobacteria bacterium]|jgi:hypothetical protein|nr:hypothetical protein [Alphaproteobacteria bacterium]MCB1551180.1 hypothetical protein [Alphaproteobacteria bacterium]MCB9985392.1 hypothetical protein [Micavibrio sp.]HPQ50641.1 hypothetical protein [Alphaproteobacteria bacterium]HRK98170.1 hypothetical protein [Alphaproteobacteria bacterium]